MFDDVFIPKTPLAKEFMQTLSNSIGEPVPMRKYVETIHNLRQIEQNAYNHADAYTVAEMETAEELGILANIMANWAEGKFDIDDVEALPEDGVVLLLAQYFN